MDTLLFKKESKLSNYYICKVIYNNIEFNSSEAAYQSQKFCDINMQLRFVGLTPDQSKHLARRWKQNWRIGWDTYKLNVMYEIVKNKMLQNKDCLIELMSTNNMLIVEDTTGWHDNIWGYCRCDKCKNKEHTNYLGKILMRIREEFRIGGIYIN